MPGAANTPTRTGSAGPMGCSGSWRAPRRIDQGKFLRRCAPRARIDAPANSGDTPAMKRAASLEQAPGLRPSRVRARLENLLASCGIDVDGPNAWDIQVHHEDFHARVLADGSLGLGESYMEGWWEVRDLDGFIFRLLVNHVDEKVAT